MYNSVMQDSLAVSITTPKLSCFLPLHIAIYDNAQPGQGPPSQRRSWLNKNTFCVCFVLFLPLEQYI